jgi:UPF0755 protein
VKTFFQSFVIAFLIFILWLGYALLDPIGPATQQFVTIRPKTSTRQIAADLRHAGTIRSAYAFLLLYAASGRRTIKAGEYAFEHPATAFEVYDRLGRGDVYVHTVVIPEGFNMFDVADALQTAKVCPREEFLKVARTDLTLIKDLDPQAKSLEGYLFPDTYRFSRIQSPHEVAAAMVKSFRQAATSIALNTDLHRVVTLASIVEKETSVSEERPLVAGVFQNRLKDHIGLATDPSVIYASKLIGKFDGTIHHSDLALDSPYNTYKYSGLPPGPIANPGVESLKAAMHPAQTDYLYFVANNKGGHNFARTIEEHNHNVALYRRELNGSANR